MDGELLRLSLLTNDSGAIDELASGMLFEGARRRRESNGSVQNVNLGLGNLIEFALPVENLDWMGPRYYKLRERLAYLSWSLTPA